MRLSTFLQAAGFTALAAANLNLTNVEPRGLISKYFPNLENVTYEALEYVPLLGTIYAVKRTRDAHQRHHWKRQWAALANVLESVTRDVLLFSEVVEPTQAVLFHTMSETFTDRMMDIMFDAESEPKIKIQGSLQDDPNAGYLVVAESKMGQHQERLFSGESKGLHLFHGARFSGVLEEPTYAPKGAIVYLDVPDGFITGGRVSFTWRWSTNAQGNKDVPEATLGRLRIEPGNPTRFGLAHRKGAGWGGYDFWGTIDTEELLKVTTRIDGSEINITFRRVYSVPS